MRNAVASGSKNQNNNNNNNNNKNNLILKNNITAPKTTTTITTNASSIISATGADIVGVGVEVEVDAARTTTISSNCIEKKLLSSNSSRMQPTLPQAAGIADMDLTAVQSMDWIFKKEQIYLLAQFWQQRATLAEKEVNTLKEQLSTNTTTGSTKNEDSEDEHTDGVTENISKEEQDNNRKIQNNNNNNNNSNNNNNNNTKLLNSVAAAITLHHNGGDLLTTTPSPSPPPTDSVTPTSPSATATASNGCINPKLFFNHAQQMMMEAAAAAAAAAAAVAAAKQNSPMHSPALDTAEKQTVNTDNKQTETNDKSQDMQTNENKVEHMEATEIIEGIDDDDDDEADAEADAEAEADDDNDCEEPEEHAACVAESTDESQLKVSSRNNSKNNIHRSAKKYSSTESLDEDDAASDKKFQEEEEEEDAMKTDETDGEALENNNTNNNRRSSTPTAYEHNQPTDLLAAKDKEIKALFDEVQRLRTLEQTHIVQIHRLEEHLEAKRQHIMRLEARLDKQQMNAALAETSATATESAAAALLPTAAAATPAEQKNQHDDELIENDDDEDERRARLSPTTTSNIEDNEHETDTKTNKKENHNALKLDAISQQSVIAAAAAAAAACANDPNKFQELLLERTKAFAAAEALKNSTEDAMHHTQHFQQQQQQQQQTTTSNMDGEKLSHHHNESSTSASTPNLCEASRLADQEHLHGTHSLNGSMSSLSMSLSKFHEDNNNSLCATPNSQSGLSAHPHLPSGFLPGLPFQFQDRGHFRFADDLQLPPGASMAGRLGESLIPKGDPMEAKLQEMLRYNMDKYANQALDTLHISRRVRELLSVHNIGQRLFAKYILGLSQGTVSELLSKPKPWDKLTEKGRDSYRKMHAWGCDDNAVMLLKSLIPKKDSGLPPYGSGREDAMAEDRIAHILNEASSLIKNSSHQQLKEEQQHRRSAHDESHSNEDSKSPLNSCTSPFYKNDMNKSSQDMSDVSPQQQSQAHGHRMRPDDSAQDKMARLYQEIMSRAPRESAFPGFLFSPLFNAGGLPPTSMAGGGFPMAADENIRMAFEREMAKLQQQSNNMPNFPNFSSLMALQQQVLSGAAQDLSLLPNKDLKDFKLNGQRAAALEMGGNSMDSQTSNSQKLSNKDMNSADNSDRQSAGYGMLQRKMDADGRITPVGSGPGAPSSSASTHNTNSTAPSPMSNTILPPAMAAGDDFNAAASPLQRMASITNSLITQPPVTPHHSQPQRPTKAVLPPITQQQFDMFNNLNTEDIVRRVKEALSQYSISQRLFGESVLGLSQGSVSDLLARPKPWHMLTQKGREPFIRMKMFLEDENAVHKLVASQYKIAPEKLMRTGSYSGSPQIPQGLANKMQASLPMQQMMKDLKLQEPSQAQHIMQQMQAAAAMSVAMQHQQQNQQHAAQAAAAAAAQHHQNMLLTSPGLPPQHAISLPSSAGGQDKKPMMMPMHSPHQGAGPDVKKPMMMPIHSPHQANAMRNMHQHMSPTVYEMAALTQDLDTQVITTKIKEALLANNIGQKIFGEAVLGLSQGSVSELLSKPKPWHMLSIKGREPFIRMQLWLSDANNVERLQVLKNERREASKRRRSTGPNQQDNSSDTSSNDTNDFYTSSPGPGSVGSSVSGAPPNKKQRVLFSEEQKEALRLAFALDPYPNVATIEFLANELGLATRTITNWFHNHRMRLKQQVPHGQPGADNPIPSRENTNATPFDPVQFRILLQQRLLELHKERMGLNGPPIAYPPYFAAAALLGRSLAGMPGMPNNPAGEPDLHALNQAFKEQMSGLDLSMSSLKRERNEDYDDDIDGSHLSDNEGSLDDNDTDSKCGEFKETPRSTHAAYLANARSSSRRKPAAPQWVNPANSTTTNVAGRTEGDHVINGVCVMQGQASDYSRPREGDETNNAAELADSEVTQSDINKCNSDQRKSNNGSPNSSLDVDPSFMEPVVHIKQEEDNCDSDTEISTSITLNATDSKDDKMPINAEEKLRPPTWNY